MGWGGGWRAKQNKIINLNFWKIKIGRLVNYTRTFWRLQLCKITTKLTRRKRKVKGGGAGGNVVDFFYFLFFLRQKGEGNKTRPRNKSSKQKKQGSYKEQNQ